MLSPTTLAQSSRCRPPFRPRCVARKTQWPIPALGNGSALDLQKYADICRPCESIGDHVQETTSRSLDTAGLVKLLKLKYMNKYVEMAWHELKWFEMMWDTGSCNSQDVLWSSPPHIAAVPDPESCNSKRLSADCTGSTSHVWLDVDAASISCWAHWHSGYFTIWAQSQPQRIITYPSGLKSFHHAKGEPSTPRCCSGCDPAAQLRTLGGTQKAPKPRVRGIHRSCNNNSQ